MTLYVKVVKQASDRVIWRHLVATRAKCQSNSQKTETMLVKQTSIWAEHARAVVRSVPAERVASAEEGPSPAHLPYLSVCISLGIITAHLE